MTRRLTVGLCLPLLVAPAIYAQEVRRALPVDHAAATPVPMVPIATPVSRPAASPEPTKSDDDSVIRVAPVTPGVANPANPEQIQLELANGFYARKIYDMAAPEYEKYLGIYPNASGRESALFRLGECYRVLGNLNAAKTSYDSLVSAQTNGEFVGPAAYRLGDLYYQEKNFSAALPMFRKASQKAKDPAVATAAKFYLARCLEFQRLNSEAREAYGELVTAKGDNPYRDASRLSLAQLLSDANRKSDALKQYEALAQETEKPEVKVEALVKAALLRIDLGETEKAATALNDALKMPEIGKWRDVAQLGLLRMLYESGKHKQVLESFAASSKDYSPEIRPEAMLLAANSHRQLGEGKEARDLYDQVIHDYPGTSHAAEAQYDRIVSLYNSNDPGLLKEVDDYLAAASDSERKDRITLLKAEALFKKQDYENAAVIYAAIDQSKLSSALKAEALYKLGWCCLQIKAPERAIKAFTQFIDTNPKHKMFTSALAQRAVAYQQAKNFSAALKDFNDLISHYPKAKERELALQQKALVLGQQQDNAGMAETFKLLLKDYPQSVAAAQANYWIGWAAFEMKDYKNAIAPFAAARQVDKEQFYERATLRIMLCNYYLEQRAPLAQEVDDYLANGGKGKVPAEILRWLGGEFFKDNDFAMAEKYLALLTARKDEAAADDWLNLARSLIRENKCAPAIEAIEVYLRSAVQPAPHAVGLLTKGEAQLGLEQYDAAQKSVDEACSLQPEGRLNAEGRSLSGQIQMARGEYNQAAKTFMSVAVVFDDPQITPQALEKAYEALKKSGNEKDAAKVLNDLQSRYPEYQLRNAKQS
jgi:TolA-binding protein